MSLLFLFLLPAVGYFGLSAFEDWWSATVTIVLPNQVGRRYDEVVRVMRHQGAPSLRAVRDGEDRWILLEGSHRATAAMRLGRRIQVVECADDEIVDVDCYDDVDRRFPPSSARFFAAIWSDPVELTIAKRRLRVVKFAAA
ncbi:MAG: hypothetical protein ACRYG8_27530 [Janthinobacterium lividum]